MFLSRLMDPVHNAASYFHTMIYEDNTKERAIGPAECLRRVAGGAGGEKVKVWIRVHPGAREATESLLERECAGIRLAYKLQSLSTIEYYGSSALDVVCSVLFGVGANHPSVDRLKAGKGMQSYSVKAIDPRRHHIKAPTRSNASMECHTSETTDISSRSMLESSSDS